MVTKNNSKNKTSKTPNSKSVDVRTGKSKTIETKNAKYVIISEDSSGKKSTKDVTKFTSQSSVSKKSSQKTSSATSSLNKTKTSTKSKNISAKSSKKSRKKKSKLFKFPGFNIHGFSTKRTKPSKKPIVSQSSKVLPFKLNYQATAALVLTIASLLVLSAFGTFKFIFSDENLTSYYSTDGYAVYLNNEFIANVREKSDIDSALQKIQFEYELKNRTSSNVITEFTFVEAKLNDSQLTSSEQLYSQLSDLVVVKSTAYGIFVDGERIGAFKEKSEAEEFLQEVHNYFVQGVDQEQILESNFAENVEIKEVSISLDELSDSASLLEYVIIGTDEKIEYTVQAGDSYWTIASRNGMTTDELFAANPDADENKLMPNDVLSLVVPVPVINVNIKRNIIVEENIPFETETEYVSYMYSDQQKVKRGGTYGIAEVGYTITEQNGIEVAREEISREVISNPVSKIILVGTQDPPPKVGVGVFIHPLPGSITSSYFGPRWGTYHGGHDFAKASGSDILAADGGTVTFAGWGGYSYGYMVDIDHGGGWTTRYAHCSYLYVSAGEKVYQGQTIAAVGSTGYSTGPHLHFEVMKYGTKLNPLKYINQYYK